MVANIPPCAVAPFRWKSRELKRALSLAVTDLELQMGIGLGNDMINIPFMYMSGNEIDLSLLFRYANCYPRAIRQSSHLLFEHH